MRAFLLLIQVRKPAPVPREPYTGDVFDLAAELERNATISETAADAINSAAADPANIHVRGKTTAGGRNLQV